MICFDRIEKTPSGQKCDGCGRLWKVPGLDFIGVSNVEWPFVFASGDFGYADCVMVRCRYCRVIKPATFLYRVRLAYTPMDRNGVKND